MTEMVDTLINGRWPLKLPKHRADRPQWPWWEATRLAAMHHFIEPHDTVYDIGAEEGDFPALFASWGAETVLVEPNPKVWPNIRAIYKANNLKPLATVQGLASDKSTGNAVVQTDWPKCAYGDIIGDHGFINLSEAGDTPQFRMDELHEAGAKPDVLTIDTEGSELRILKGAQQMLVSNQPIVFVSIHREFMKEMYGDNDADLHEFMENLGYHPTFLTKDHEEHWLFHPERSFH